VATLELAGVSARYGALTALRELDLQVADGELLVLVGPSGCGKTTALRTVAGLVRPSAGEVRLAGRDVTGEPPGRRNVAMVFQSYALFPHLDVAANMGFGLRARRVPRAEAAARVERAAAAIGCEHLLARRPWELSGGERQRVALARALVREPDAFLLDEPLSNLDALLRVQMRAELRGLQQRLGATMVHVTHDQVEAMTIGDRLAVLDRGVLQQVGDADALYRRPANRFVARFIGSPAMNLLPGALDDGLLRAGPFAVRAPAGRLDGRLECGVRPEHVRVVDGDGVPARVALVETAGSETFVHVDASGHALIARGGPDLRPPVGALIRLAVDPPDVHVFDAGSGAALR
jgi:ABC-type sugar transport system ATPase subunit